MLESFLGKQVVVDLRSPYVCLGYLEKFDDQFLLLRDADLHDMRDSDTTRENYVAASFATGIKRNRRRVLLVRADVAAVTRFDDLVDADSDE
jgi:small nuclear ribonucleoprotein (snRNP)-like protein